MPSRSSWLKITLKLPTQTQEPSRALRAIHKDKDLDIDIESKDDEEDDHPHGGGGKRPLTTRDVKWCSRVSLCPLMFGWMKWHERRNNWMRLKSHCGARRQPASENTSLREELKRQRRSIAP